MPERIGPEASQNVITKFYEVARHVWVDIKLKSRPVAKGASKSNETQGSRTHGSQDKLTYTNS